MIDFKFSYLGGRRRCRSIRIRFERTLTHQDLSQKRLWNWIIRSHTHTQNFFPWNWCFIIISFRSPISSGVGKNSFGEKQRAGGIDKGSTNCHWWPITRNRGKPYDMFLSHICHITWRKWQSLWLFTSIYLLFT